MAGSVHSVLSSPMKGGHRGPARPAGPRADGGQRSPHFGEAATLGGHTGTQRRGRGPAGGRLACLIPGPPPCPAPSLLAPPGHVFLARSGPSSILIAIIPCNGVGWRPLCGGPEQHTPLRGPVWVAWRLGTRGSQRLPAMVSLLVYERALSPGELFLRLEETAIIQGLLISQNTIRNNQTSSSLASRYEK
jgi:hypothetical protein